MRSLLRPVWKKCMPCPHSHTHMCTHAYCHTKIYWCYTGAALVPHWHYTGATLVLHWCHTGAALVPHWRYTGATLVPLWCYTGAALVLHTGATLCYTGATLVLPFYLPSGSSHTWCLRPLNLITLDSREGQYLSRNEMKVKVPPPQAKSVY